MRSGQPCARGSVPIHQSSRPGAGTRILGDCPLTSRLTSNRQQTFPTQRGIAHIAALARDSERFVMTDRSKLRGQIEKKEAASSFFSSAPVESL